MSQKKTTNSQYSCFSIPSKNDGNLTKDVLHTDIISEPFYVGMHFIFVQYFCIIT